MTHTPDDSDDAFRALSDARRRHVLYYLREHDAASLDELADVLAGWLTVDSETLTTPKRRERLQIGLHHVHLPMLDDVGFVAYDHQSGDAELRDLPPAVEDMVDASLAWKRSRMTGNESGEAPQEG